MFDIKELVEASSIMLAAVGIGMILLSPESSIFINFGLLFAFIGAVVYGGLPSGNPIESVIAKVPVPIIILGMSLAAVLWKVTKPEVFYQDMLWWAFGSFMIGSIIAPSVQNLLKN